MTERPEPKIPRRIILNAVAMVFDFKIEQITGSSRDCRLVRARFAACHMMRDMTGSTFPEIGRTLGDRDHSTMLHAYRRATGWLADGGEFARRYEAAKLKVVSWRATGHSGIMDRPQAPKAPKVNQPMPAVKFGAPRAISNLARAVHDLDDPAEVRLMRESVQGGTDRLAAILEGMRPL